MKKFIKKLMLFSSLLISIIVSFFFINSLIIKKYELLIVEKSKNKLILGASRTESGIDDKYLNGSFNISGSGDPLFYNLIKLRILKNNNPIIDTVFLSLDNRTLDSKIASHFYRPISVETKLQKYFNFLSISDLKQFFYIDTYTTFKAMFYIPKYTLKLIKNIFLNPKKNNILNIGGYLVVNHVVNQDIIDDFMKNDSISNYTLSNIEIENLNRIIDFCNLNSIELIFINPPIHPVMYNSLEYQEGKILFDVLLKTKYPNYIYLDFSDQFLPDSCYADLIHLNINGAKLFSKKLDSLLKIPK